MQTAVEVDSHLILGQFVTQAPNDREQMEPALAEMAGLPSEPDTAKTVLADNGYFSAGNVAATHKAGVTPLIALGRERHNVLLAERIATMEAAGDKAPVVDGCAGQGNVATCERDDDVTAEPGAHLASEHMIRHVLIEDVTANPDATAAVCSAHVVPLCLRDGATKAQDTGKEPTILEKMTQALQTPEGRALYGKRKGLVEPVFGQIKRVLGFRQFMLRGFESISGEWTLVAQSYNLNRMFGMNSRRKQIVSRRGFNLPALPT